MCSRNRTLLPICLVPVVALQNLVCQSLLEDHCGVLLLKKKGRDQDSQQGGLALQRVTCHSDIEELEKKEKSGTSFSNLLYNTQT